MKPACRLAFLVALLVAAPQAANAKAAMAATAHAENAIEALHILRPVIHAEQDRAELCLEADHTLDDNQRGAIVLKLESGGKRVPLPQSGIMITGTSLCLAPLEHRRSYRISLSGLKGAMGERLATPYSLSFTVPDRKPSLAFLSDLYSGGMMRWQANDPVLHGINIDQVKIELYRIKTLPLMIEAWRQHKQATLAPTESAYFARDKGELVWQGTINLDNNPNKIIEQKVALHEALSDIAPGLYLAVASDTKPPTKTAGKKNPVPLAAVWLLRSELKLQALEDKDGYAAAAGKADASAPFDDVQVSLRDANSKILAEGKTDANGVANLALDKDKRTKADLLTGMTAKGDVDFVDLAAQARINLLAPDIGATILTDRDFYAPGSNATLQLILRNAGGEMIAASDSRLYILRPDHSLLTSFPVPKSKSSPSAMAAAMTVPVPASNGTWFLLWQQNDGRKLAEIPLRVTSNRDAPQLAISADRPMIGSDGNLTLAITGKTARNEPAPFIPGRINVSWTVPERIFPNYDAYHFGGNDKNKDGASQTLPFLTDAGGQAQIHLNLTPQTSALRAAFITLQSDPAAGAADPKPLIIPVRPADFLIGIKPLAENAHFAENGVARFDIVALDSEGKRREATGLSYQIMEEGRSFEWFQDEGRWNYKPQEQTRRIGGGTLSLKADSDQRIEWPVNAGSYQLVIRGADDKTLAQIPFSAGWVSNASDSPKTSPLDILAPSLVKPGEEIRIRYQLDQPAFVTAILADDHIRKIIQLNQKAGSNSLTFPPDAGLHNIAVISILARSLNNDGTSNLKLGRVSLPLSSVAAKAPADPKKTAPEAGNPQAAARKETRRVIFSLSAEQEIAPKLSWSPAPAKSKNQKVRNATNFLLAAAKPLDNLLPLLTARLEMHSLATADIADEVVLYGLWRDVLMQTGLMTGAEIDAKRQDLLMRLTARQKADGGFTELPLTDTNSEADIGSTAAALVALNGNDQELVKLAADQAAGWLRRRLENSWLDDEERVNRAAAYAALAITGRTDNANLHYFSDTSADKVLPPVAAAQLALAFAKAKDRDKVDFWLGKITSPKEGVDIPRALLPLLAENNLFDADKLLPALARYSNDKKTSASDLYDLLRALWFVQNRAAPVSITINGSDQKSELVLVIPMPAKNAALTVRNPSDRPLYITEASAKTAAPAADSAIARRIYDANGREIPETENLHRGENYIILIEGTWNGKSGGDSSLVIHESPMAALTPLSCALDANSETGGDLAWIKSLLLTPGAVCESTNDGIDIMLTHPDNNGKRWRIAYAAKATGNGEFTLSPVAVRWQSDAEDSDSNGNGARYGTTQKLRIQ